MIAEVILEPSQLSVNLAQDGPLPACRAPTCTFQPPLDLARLPEVDVASRLITLSQTGLADELTWANY